MKIREEKIWYNQPRPHLEPNSAASVSGRCKKIRFNQLVNRVSLLGTSISWFKCDGYTNGWVHGVFGLSVCFTARHDRCTLCYMPYFYSISLLEILDIILIPLFSISLLALKSLHIPG